MSRFLKPTFFFDMSHFLAIETFPFLIKKTLSVFVFTFSPSKFIRSRLISSRAFSSLPYFTSVAKFSEALLNY